MNEELDSQLSAMFDDELPEAECQLLARRLSRDEALKARWRRYAVIGAAVRAERGVRMDVRLETNLAARVSAAISAEPTLEGKDVAEGKARRAGGFRWWQPVAGGAIAAGVAAMSVLWVRSQAPVGSEALVAENPAPTAVVVADNGNNIGNGSGGSEAYVVPKNIEPRISLPSAELANYMVAHSEFSTPVTRRFPLSTLVGTEGAAEGGVAQDETVPAEDLIENVEAK